MLGALMVLGLAPGCVHPLATMPRFSVVAAGEASKLALARTPEERVAALLDVLDERVRQMAGLDAGGDLHAVSEMALSYGRLATGALRPALDRAPSAVPAARERLVGHRYSLAHLRSTQEARVACRELLQALDGR